MTSRRLLTTEAKVLLDAADLIETHGHCKGKYEEDGKFCAVGAAIIHTAKRGWMGAVYRLSLYLDKECPAEWNDAPERTADEVVNALRQAAITAA